MAPDVNAALEPAVSPAADVAPPSTPPRLGAAAAVKQLPAGSAPPPPSPQQPSAWPFSAADAARHRAAALASLQAQDNHPDTRRPIFHPMAARGWASDPSGPVFYRGRYHLFFQHLSASCQWYWGLTWSHCVSDDLVTWRALPPALAPTPGWYDANGCFSGAVELDPETGLPTIIYTGVYLKSNAAAVAALGLPPPHLDLGLRFVETQLAAVPEDPDDPDLVCWRKLPEPVMRHPPAGLPLSCWRDPFFLKRGDPSTGKEWTVLLASGLRGRGGAVLVFKSPRLLTGWRFEGLVAQADNDELGIDWECPILARLDPLPADKAGPAAAGGGARAAAEFSGVDHGVGCGDSAGKEQDGGSEEHEEAAAAVRAALSMPAGLASWVGGGRAGSEQVPGRAESAPASMQAAAEPPPLPHVHANEPAAAQQAAAVAAAAAAAAAAASGAGTGACSQAGASSVGTQTPERANSLGDLCAAAAGDGLFAETDAAADEAAVSKLRQQLLAGRSAASEDGNAVLGGAAAEGEGAAKAGPWFFCVSPDACSNPIYYWLGRYDGSQFLIKDATGPLRLDLGRTLYAASLWPDPNTGRNLLWGWVQEHRRVPPPPCECTEFDYAGCVSLPRCLYLTPEGRLHQSPLPEVDKLRTSVSWRCGGVYLPPVSAAHPPLPLRVVEGTHLDICVTFQPPADVGAPDWSAPATSDAPGGGAAAAEAPAPHWPPASPPPAGPVCGLILKSWRPGGRGAAVVAFSWAVRRLEVHFDEPFPNAYDPFPEDVPGANVVGGTLDNMRPGEPLTLRLLLDGSALEIFTGSGEALTTRVYRGHPPEPADDTHAAAAAATAAAAAPAGAGQEAAGAACGCEAPSGICLFASGAGCFVSNLEAYEMASCWAGAGAGEAPAPSAGGGDGAEEDVEPAAAVRPAFLEEHCHIPAAAAAAPVAAAPAGPEE